MSSQRTRTVAPEPLWTTDDVARRLGATTRTVRRYAASGVLDAVRISGLLRFRAEDCNWIVSSEKLSASRY